MGIFSLFKKKDGAPTDGAGPATRLRTGEPSRFGLDEAERARQREIARATAAKIDAIESAMAFDIFNEPEPAWGSGARRPARTNAQIAADASGPDTLPPLELATTELLRDDTAPQDATAPQTAPVIEEIAIMFANNQAPVAEAMLIDSLADVGRTERTVWWMLFDLYQGSGRQEAFDDLAIDYASHFETSPPAWNPVLPAAAEKPVTGVTPTESFGPLLDESIAPQLERLLERAAASAATRLEFGRVQAVTPEGCARLLTALTVLRAGKRELIVAGAAELAEIVRSTIEIGQRDAPEAPWLLLLELLQLMNREKDFEETAMDYCVTYELSPPSFEAPANVATAADARAPSRSDRFMLPVLIDGGADKLFDAIDAYAAQSDPVVLDCSRLARVDYNAAAGLHKRLRALAAAGKTVELRDINHLVAALFKLMGFTEVARLFPHKY
ncbi:STAS domain-containing protein [Massilia sp. R2A-15]|uniref:STAS domain-containing protein n=1 Tax=Massilia sp. R2A-15 TaxID=3064278 RepID=UPI002732CBF4|nr:STAS domain-containing protein [Massilia sp. R2A-15]WLI89283.1 STAS domain-containing protein [Massilia sp. R2A-15]